MKFKMSILSFVLVLLLGFVSAGCGSVAKIAGIALVASELDKKILQLLQAQIKALQNSQIKTMM